MEEGAGDGTKSIDEVFDAFEEVSGQAFPDFIAGGGTLEDAFALMDSLKMVRRATNLNDNKTLVLHPASTMPANSTPSKIGCAPSPSPPNVKTG